MQNNSACHQDWLSQVNRGDASKRGVIAGFEYAVQPDGTCFAERRWEELRQMGGYSFVSAQDQTDNRLYQTMSLDRVESSVQASRRSYQERQALPPRPAEVASRPSDTVSSTEVALSTIQEPQHASDVPFLSPTRRIRNRHNAVYGQHLPNALNSPACAAKVFGETSAKKEERKRCQNLLIGAAAGATNETWMAPATATTDAMGTEDVDDSLFLDLDIDQLIAQREKESGRPNQSTETPFDYGDDSESSLMAIRGPPMSRRHSNGTVSTVSNEVPFRDLHNSPSTASHNTSFTSGNRDSYGSNDPNAFNGSCNNNSGYGNNNHVEVSRASSSSFTDNGRDSFSSFASAREGSFNNNDITYGSAYDSSSVMDTSNASGAPLCPGHNLPCRVLTASTATNMGRQFYKCSMPDDEKCDFFEWADGIQGNLNPPDDMHYGGGGVSAGMIKDIFQENRRVFGHHTFRPGQQDVIQNAVQGRDVFVLMPTGGGKSLCYQLPAWCCPGLSVIVSPLLSLIQDQVQSLTKLGVSAVFLNSSQDYETEQRQIIQQLFGTREHGGIKLLYITPEKLNRSGVIKQVLQTLYGKGLISRFVVDEAHCLSDWGKIASGPACFD